MKSGRRRNRSLRPHGAEDLGGPGAGAPARLLGGPAAIQASPGLQRGRSAGTHFPWVRDLRPRRPLPSGPLPGPDRDVRAAPAPSPEGPQLRESSARRSAPRARLGRSTPPFQSEAPCAPHYYLIAATPKFTSHVYLFFALFIFVFAEQNG